jgi:hypothetical protein
MRDKTNHLVHRHIVNTAKQSDISFKGRLDRQKYIKAVAYAMNFANEEIRTDRDPAKWNTTDKGADRKFRSPEEMDAFKQVYKEAVGMLRPYYPNLPTDAQIDALTRHPKTPFFNLLLPTDKTLITWGKSQVENAILGELIQWGMLDQSNIHQRAIEGYSHRVYDMPAGQQASNMTFNQLKEKEFQADKYWTGWEFYVNSDRKALVPKADYSLTLGNYLYKSMSMIDQQKYFKQLRSVRHPDFDNLPAVVFEGDMLPDIRPGQEWHDRASELGFRELKAATGLVKWTRGIFKPPYVYQGLADKLESILVKAPTSQTTNKLLRFLHQTNSFIKRYVVMLSPHQWLLQITSTPWLWMKPGLAWRYGGIKSIVTLEALRGLIQQSYFKRLIMTLRK